jgi:hypothetical protein
VALAFEAWRSRPRVPSSASNATGKHGSVSVYSAFSSKWPVRGRNKPGPPRTTGPGEQVKLRCHAEFLQAVDEWRAKRMGDKISRPVGMASAAAGK